jgi:hypothetical protein
MKKYKDNTLKYKTEIKNSFDSFEPDNNGEINIQNINKYTQKFKIKNKYPFVHHSIISLTKNKSQNNEHNISSKDYISYIDNELSDTQSKEGLQSIFSALSGGENKEKIDWMQLPKIANELGDKKNEKKLLKLIFQAKLHTKDFDFNEFCQMMNDDEGNLEMNSEDYEDKKSYKEKKKKKENKEEKEEKEEIRNISNGKNEEINMENNVKIKEEEGYEKSSKRYHRRYRDNKNKNEKNDNGNGNIANKIYTKYRKK